MDTADYLSGRGYNEDETLEQWEYVGELDEGLSDDESYDYCDDVYSIHSNTCQAMSLCPDAIGSLLTVPSTLLQDMDRVHEVVTELGIDNDLEEIRTVESSPSITTDNTKTIIAQKVGNVEKLEEVGSVTNSVPEKEEAKATPITTEKESKISESKPNPCPLPTANISRSRTSNKKRRKQLKLLKKAKAAENAERALLEQGSGTPKPTQRSGKRTANKACKVSQKSRSKRSHPHVSCATEALAAYREEIRMVKQ